MFIVNKKDTRTTPVASFWCLYCLLWTYFTPCSTVFIVDFEQLNADWIGNVFCQMGYTLNKISNFNPSLLIFYVIVIEYYEEYLQYRSVSRTLWKITIELFAKIVTDWKAKSLILDVWQVLNTSL